MCLIIGQPFLCNHLPPHLIHFCPSGISVSNICDTTSFSHYPPLTPSRNLCLECAPIKSFSGVQIDDSLQAVNNLQEIRTQNMPGALPGQPDLRVMKYTRDELLVFDLFQEVRDLEKQGIDEVPDRGEYSTIKKM
jgi:hypothetical protein